MKNIRNNNIRNNKIKTIFLLILVFCFLLTNNIFASLSLPHSPKKYIITINNLNSEDIKSIEIIYQTGFAFNYESNNDYRKWLTSTEFGYKYKDYTDEQIIPTLSTEEIDEIAYSYTHKDPSVISGYWLDLISNSGNTDLAKYAINSEVEIKYYNNAIEISYPGFRYSNLGRYSDTSIIRIVTNDNKTLYSKQIDSYLTCAFDEHSSNESVEKAKDVLDKIAYFEVDYTNITDNFEVKEITKEKTDTSVSSNILSNKFALLILGAVIILLVLSIILKNKIFK